LFNGKEIEIVGTVDSETGVIAFESDFDRDRFCSTRERVPVKRTVVNN
jgi:hypothetical protein